MSPEANDRADLPTGIVTFLFTDIEGSTRLSQTLGTAFAEVVDRHHHILRTAIEADGGRVVSTEGDAFFAVFARAAGAVEATIAAQRALDLERWPGGIRLRVRMGMHTGDGRLGGDDYAGVDVNHAARISAAGHGGQVLLSAATVEAVRDDLPAGTSLRRLGDHRLKDFDAFEPIHQLDIDGRPSEFQPLRADRPGWVPDQLTDFLGRESEVEAVGQLLRRSRMVTLTGPGGTGKTRLSIEVAQRCRQRYAGGAWFVPLEAIREPDFVLPELADRLDVRASTPSSLLESIGTRLAGKETLFVLDNLEQVVEVGPSLVRLLSAVPTLRILASSREPLRVSGEQEFAVPTLSTAEGVRLFIERARQVRADFEPSESDIAVIERIVERLDGLPLAIELAAARARLFPPPALLERLDGRLRLLTGGSRDLPDRQRTLRGAIDWSYQLLDVAERTVFARLGVFSGGAQFDSVAGIVDPDHSLETDVQDVLSSLAEKSLLRIEEEPACGTRVRLLETLREYAAERLAVDPLAADVRERHALHFLGFAEAIEKQLTGIDPGEAAERVEIDHDNLRAAMDWSEQAGRAWIGLRIGGAIWRFWQNRAHMIEGRDRMRHLLAEARADESADALARGSTALGGLLYWLGDYARARSVYEVALEQYRRTGDERGIAHALYDLSFPLAILGENQAAAEAQRESLERFTASADEEGVALAKEALAVVALFAEDFEVAARLASEVIPVWRSLGRTMKVTDDVMFMAVVETRRGEMASARRYLNEGIEITRRIADQSGYAGLLQVGAIVALGEKRPEHAAVLIGGLQALRLKTGAFLVASDALGQPDPEAIAREQLGERFETYRERGQAMTIDALMSWAAAM